jgi:hypothetical protein
VDGHFDPAAPMRVENRIFVAMDRVMMVQGFVMTFLEDEEFRGLDAAAFKQTEQVGDDHPLLQLVSVERHGFDRYEDNRFHVFDPVFGAGDGRS